MLGKLMKYDMKYMARILPWIYLGAGVLSGIVALLSALSIKSGADVFISYALITAIPLFLTIAAISVCSTIFMMVRIYKNMFSDEGYLTFTLPVKKSSIIWSKLLTGAVWNVFGFLVTIGSIALPVVVILTVAAKSSPDASAYLALIWEYISAVFRMLKAEPDFILSTVTLVLQGIVSLFSTSALFLLACSLAQRLNKNRGIASVGIYLGLNFGVSIISSIVSEAAAKSSLTRATEEIGSINSVSVLSLFSYSSLSSVTVSAIVTVLAVLLSYLIINKKLNIV